MPRLPALAALACCGLLAAGGAAAAQGTTWLTVTGDPADASSDVVQIEPESVVVFSNLRTIRIRVSRASPRNGYDERPYRGFIAAVHIDCTSAAARYRQLQYFAGPLWSGAGRVVNYTDATMPPMVFRDIEPNPTTRIVQAACTLDRVQVR